MSDAGTTRGRVAARWTQKLLRDGFTPVANFFLDHYSEIGVTSTEAMFLIHLVRFKRDEGHPWPSYRVLSQKMGIHDRRARQIAKSLEDKKLLVRIGRRDQETLKWHSNEFNLTLLFEALERLADALDAKKKQEAEEQSAREPRIDRFHYVRPDAAEDP